MIMELKDIDSAFSFVGIKLRVLYKPIYLPQLCEIYIIPVLHIRKLRQRG